MMNTLLIIAAFFVLLMISIAFLRIRLIINSMDDRYELRIVPLARVRLVIDDDTIGYRWDAFMIHGNGQLFPPIDHNKKQGPKKKASKRKRKKPLLKFKDMIKLGKALWKGLRVRRFYLRLNMHDPVYNAWLLPAFSLWRSRGHDVAVQWVGDPILILDAEHSVHRVAGAFIHTLLTKNKK